MLNLKITMLYDRDYPVDGKMNITRVYLEPAPEQAASNIVYLYKNGLTYETITGGWNNHLGGRNGNWITYSADMSNCRMTLTEPAPSQWSQCGIYTNNDIDFSKYSKLYIEYECEENLARTCVQYSAGSSFGYANEDSLDNSKGSHVTTFDINSVTGSLKLKILLITSGTDSSLYGNGKKLYIDKVYLEKKAE